MCSRGREGRSLLGCKSGYPGPDKPAIREPGTPSGDSGCAEEALCFEEEARLLAATSTCVPPSLLPTEHLQ